MSKLYKIIATILLLLSISSPAVAADGPSYASCALSWKMNGPITNLVSFNIYMADVPNSLPVKFINVPSNNASPSLNVIWNTPCPTAIGQYYATVTAIDSNNAESPPSSVVPFSIVPLSSVPSIPQPPVASNIDINVQTGIGISVARGVGSGQVLIPNTWSMQLNGVVVSPTVTPPPPPPPPVITSSLVITVSGISSVRVTRHLVATKRIELTIDRYAILRAPMVPSGMSIDITRRTTPNLNTVDIIVDIGVIISVNGVIYQ